VPIITFIHPDGTITKADAKPGDTLLKVALATNVPMEGACGGNGFCTTCLCEAIEGAEHLSPRNDREENMGVTEGNQRLGCQAEVQGDVTVKLLGM
jgi:adenylate cyclase